MKILKKLKKFLLKWLFTDKEVLKEVVIPYLKVRDLNTDPVWASYIDFEELTSDPSLAPGRMWYRKDLDQWRYSPDGTVVKTMGISNVVGHFVGDDTEKSVVGTTPTVLKWHYIGLVSDVTYSKAVFVLEGKVTSGTGYYDIVINGNTATTLQTTSTVYTFMKATVDISGLSADSIHKIEIRVYNSDSSGTTYLRVYELYILP